MNTNLTLKTISTHLENFKNLIKNGNELSEKELSNLYAKTFGFENFEELEKWLFIEGCYNGHFSNKSLIDYANQKESLAFIALEKQYINIEEINDPSDEMVFFALKESLDNILYMKELKQTYFDVVFDKEIVRELYPLRNDEVDVRDYRSSVLDLLFMKCDKQGVYPTEEQIIKMLDIAPCAFELIPKNLWSEAVRMKAVSNEAKNISLLMDLEESEGIVVLKEEKLAAIRNVPSIIWKFKQDQEMVDLAFSIDIHSFKHFEEKFQTNELAKKYIDAFSGIGITSLKRQNEEIIQYALDNTENAAAFVTPHFRKKMRLSEKYNIQSSYAKKLNR